MSTSVVVVTDEELLEQFIQTGDQSKFHIIHHRHAESIKVFLAAKYLGGDLDTADDVVQDTFLKLIEQHGQYNREHRLRPWLFSIAANLAIDIQRAQGRRPALSFSQEGLQMPAGSHSLDEASDYNPQDCRCIEAVEHASLKETVTVIQELLTLLSEKDRASVEAVFIRGLSFSEAGRHLELPMATVKTRVYRALELMRTSAASSRLVA